MTDHVRDKFNIGSTIAVCDPDHLSSSAVTGALTASGYQALEVDQQKGDPINAIRGLDPCLLVVGWELPIHGGEKFMRQLRQDNVLQDIPVLVLTECCDSRSRIESLESGADDCMSKPLSLRELVLRAESLLRRTLTNTVREPKTVLRVNGLELDASSLTLRANGELFYLNASEFRLLHLLMRKRGEVVTRLDLRNHSSANQNDLDERSIDVYIMRLRKVLKQYGQDHLIQTVRGIGYRMVI